MKRTLLSVLLLGMFAQSQAASLMDVYEAARTHDATLASAEAAYRATTEKIPQAQSALKPQINASGNITYNREVLPGSFPGFPSTFSGTTGGLTLSLTQPLYHRDRQIQVTESRSVVDQARAQLETARQDLMLRVAQAYFNVLIAQDAITSLAAQKAAVMTQLAAARRSFQVGNTTVTDVNEATARVDQVTAQQVAAQNRLDVARRVLESLTGAPMGTLKGLGKAPTLGLKTTGIDRWTEAALENSLRIKVQEQALRQAGLEIERQRAARLPTVDLVASESRTGGQLNILQPKENTSVGVQLNIPIYEGGLISSRTREAVANRKKSQSNLEQAKRDVTLQTQQAYLTVESGMAQVRALEQSLKSAQSNLNSTRLAVSVGVRTNVDLLNALQTYYNAEQSLEDARYNLIVNEIRLAAAASLLNEGELARVNAVLTRPAGTSGPVRK